MKKLERDVESELIVDVASRGGYCLKVVMLGRRSFPDRLVCLPGRRPFLVELKRPGERPTAKQRNMHQLLSEWFETFAWDGEQLC